MKNQKFIQALNQTCPSNVQKEKMLQKILKKQEKKKMAFGKYGWQFMIYATCICICFLVTGDGIFEKKSIEPIPTNFIGRRIEEPRIFCFEGSCYEESELVTEQEANIFLYSIFEEEKEIKIYQGDNSDGLIFQMEDFYFLYKELK